MNFDAALKRLTKASGGQGRGCEPGMTKVRINDLEQLLFQFLNLDQVVRTMEEKEREAQFWKFLEDQKKAQAMAAEAPLIVVPAEEVKVKQADRSDYFREQLG